MIYQFNVLILSCWVIQLINRSFLKDKIKIFNNLDEYSQTFLSIHTRAKITLREFKEDYFEGSYLELLRLILTLPESLGYGKLKSISFKLKDEAELLNTDKYMVGDNVTSEKIQTSSEIKPNTVLLKTGASGKQMQKEKEKKIKERNELNSITFDDEELTDEEFEEFENESAEEDFDDIDL